MTKGRFSSRSAMGIARRAPAATSRSTAARETMATPRFDSTAFLTEAVKKAVESNLGVAIVSRAAVEREVAAGALRAMPIADLELKRPFVMFYRQGKYFGPMARDFMVHMRGAAPHK